MKSPLSDIKERLSRATPGPWKYVRHLDEIPCSNRVQSHDGKFITKGASDTSPWDISEEDGDFIAHSYDDISYLIKELESLQQKYNEVTENHTVVINLQELPDA